MISDLNKGITSIAYNYLNLPDLITFGNGNTIQYIYNSMGMKVKKTINQVYPATNPQQIFKDYLDGFQYCKSPVFPTIQN